MAKTFGFVNRNCEGEWVIELFCGSQPEQRKLSIYIRGEDIDYLKSWGARMDIEMEDGSISKRPQQWDFLLGWLTGEGDAREEED